ncbi:hypothetical protein SLEP1_g14422 [Rubroshorea leprosula]|uniref:Uncharacterized protein n=1 Tax=Rubroshorea leprosula TaxID=152421 RepID=A0AAV5ITJ6_9ROSI|nr:hypothetical protein SLEP1_g14422 [Rubroshorea leprosula]
MLPCARFVILCRYRFEFSKRGKVRIVPPALRKPPGDGSKSTQQITPHDIHDNTYERGFFYSL